MSEKTQIICTVIISVVIAIMVACTLAGFLKYLQQDSQNRIDGRDYIEEAYIESQNSKLEMYKGSNIKGIDVFDLVGIINELNEQKSYPKEIETICQSANGQVFEKYTIIRDMNYEVSFQYDENGYISKTIIKEK